jgi:hypothetical protein
MKASLLLEQSIDHLAQCPDRDSAATAETGRGERASVHEHVDVRDAYFQECGGLPGCAESVFSGVVDWALSGH